MAVIALKNLSQKIDVLTSMQISLIVAVLAFVVRLPFAIFAPVLSPDSQSYLTVSRNILLNGCVSLSDPASGVCQLHWGGNHLPGYPAFIALFGANIELVLIAQIALYSIACAYLVWTLKRLWEKPVVVLAVGLILALSPLQVGWGRFVLPDLLSHSVFVWVVAELALSVRNNELRWFNLGIASACAVFLRYDGILLTIPIAITGFWLHDVKAALGKGLLIAMIMSLPLAGWWVRSVSHGLSWIPEQRFMYDGSYSPDGYRSWIRTWASTLDQAAAAAYPVATKNYSRIQIHSNAWGDEREKRLVLKWLEELSQIDGQNFPKRIDNFFRNLALNRRNGDPFYHYVVLPALRANAFWFNPYYSFGLPGVELSGSISKEDREQIRLGGIEEQISVALKYPFASFVKSGLFLYRIFLFCFVILLILFVINTSSHRNRCLLGSLLGFALLKVLLLSFQASVDSRYLLSVFAAVEIFMIFVVSQKLNLLKSERKLIQTD